MAHETDALSSFDLNKLGGGGLFLKFEAGKPVTLRFLTVDPMVRQQEFTDKVTGEVNISMKFAFIVYNFTDEVVQIAELTAGLMRRIGSYHQDNDFGADLRKMDIKIIPSGEGKERRYDVQVLRHSGTETKLSSDQIKQAAGIDLPAKVQGYRLSEWEKMQKEKLKPGVDAPPDEVIDDISDEPINLDDIPF